MESSVGYGFAWHAWHVEICEKTGLCYSFDYKREPFRHCHFCQPIDVKLFP